MNRFTRSSIALATLTLAGVFSFAPKASASDATITIATTVNASCTFGAAAATGVLGIDFSTNTLDTTGTGGTTATIPLTCNYPGSKLTISNVVLDQPPNASSYVQSQLVKVQHPQGSTNYTYDGNTGTGTYGTPISISPSTDATVSIDAKAVYSAPLIAGNYKFTINLSATP